MIKNIRYVVGCISKTCLSYLASLFVLVLKRICSTLSSNRLMNSFLQGSSPTNSSPAPKIAREREPRRSNKSKQRGTREEWRVPGSWKTSKKAKPGRKSDKLMLNILTAPLNFTETWGKLSCCMLVASVMVTKEWKECLVERMLDGKYLNQSCTRHTF